MKIKKLNIITFEIITIIIALIMSFSFITVSAEGLEEIYYNSETKPSLISLEEEILNYTRKEVLIDSVMSLKTPNYYDRDSNFKNGCAAIAGAVIVGYYDTKLENIIPNYNSYIKRGGNIVYKPIDTNIINIMNDLYIRMKVNTTGAGATEEQFKIGLKDYVEDKGYRIDYTSYGAGNRIDYESIVNSFNNGEPVVLFLTMSHLITNLEIGETKLSMTKSSYNANHILIANGIKQVRYYNGNKVIRTDTYLSVSSGLKSYTNNDYIWLESTLAVNDILGVKIN